MALSATLVAQLRATQTGSNDFGSQTFAPTMEKILSLTDGTTAGKADILWMDERTVNSASNDDLDLAGVLSSAFGTTISLAELVAVFIINESRAGVVNTTNLTVGVGTTPVTPAFMGGTTPTFGPIRPGGFLFFGCPDAAGFGTVTAGTADILRIANSSGAAATYQIAIIGRSA